MLPALVLCIAIRAEFWRPHEKQGKAEWITHTFGHFRPVTFGLWWSVVI